ncbi:hypothetical protein SDD30_15285 [Moorella naiadis]|uniref:hypothetical protein n=1 Tax=Moorella naiadis (nom. illeg.) TaxID=3093670 RepID=UPI003D9C86D1
MKPTFPAGPDNPKSRGSRDRPTLLELESFAVKEAEKRILEEIDIASEIYLARNWSHVHYADLMDGAPPGTASKEMLLGWLNDYVRHNKILRPGIVRLYRRERPKHFEGGVWSASRLCQYIEYVARKLTDPAFVGKERAYLFNQSFHNQEWFSKAVAVCGLKLLEDCYLNNALKSHLAAGYMRIMYHSRQQLEDTAGIIGRAFKNAAGKAVSHKELEVLEGLKNGLRRVAEVNIKAVLREHLAFSVRDEEYFVYKKWLPRIEADLKSVPEKVTAVLPAPAVELPKRLVDERFSDVDDLDDLF